MPLKFRPYLSYGFILWAYKMNKLDRFFFNIKCMIAREVFFFKVVSKVSCVSQLLAEFHLSVAFFYTYYTSPLRKCFRIQVCLQYAVCL